MNSYYNTKCALIIFSLLISTTIFAGSRINPGITEGAQPMEYRTGVYLDQNFPLPLTQNDVVSTKITISQSGWYALSENITGDIEITGDNVKLDFNGYTLNGQLTIDTDYVTVDLQGGFVYASKTGILVNAGKHDILVMNGTIDLNTATTGDTDCLSIAGTLGYECYNIAVQDMFIKDFPTRGINVEYTNEITISGCHVTGTSNLATILRGISCEYVQRGVIEHCSIMQLTNTSSFSSRLTCGIYIKASDDVYIYECQAIEMIMTGGFHTLYGMYSYQSNLINFNHCIVQNITGYGTASGIRISDNTHSIVQHCMVNSISYFGGISGIYLGNTTDSFIHNNLVGLVTQTGTGVGNGIIDFNGTNNVFTRNIAYNNDTNYANVSNVESGYDGTQSNLNVALPNTP